MKRFRLSTLMLLVVIAAACCALPGGVREAARSHIALEYRFAELQRMFMVILAVSGFALAKRAREVSRRDVGLRSSGEAEP